MGSSDLNFGGGELEIAGTAEELKKQAKKGTLHFCGAVPCGETWGPEASVARQSIRTGSTKKYQASTCDKFSFTTLTLPRQKRNNNELSHGKENN